MPMGFNWCFQFKLEYRFSTDAIKKKISAFERIKEKRRKYHHVEVEMRNEKTSMRKTSASKESREREMKKKSRSYSIRLRNGKDKRRETFSVFDDIEEWILIRRTLTAIQLLQASCEQFLATLLSCKWFQFQKIKRKMFTIVF